LPAAPRPARTMGIENRPPVEQAARLAMPAVTPAERHNPELYGSPNAIRRQDWRRGRKTARSTQWSKPPGLPCRRSRRQSDTISSCTGVPSANRRQDWRRGPHDCALHLQPPSRVGAAQRVRPLSSHLRVLRVLRGLFSPCPLWFAFSVPSPPPVTTFPKSFSLSFSTTSHSPFLLLLLPSCMLKVKGAADALVGARTADGASPGQRRRRPQPLPSPDGGELRSLKPAAGGEQAGGGLLT
jgi:hypothetical protein